MANQTIKGNFIQRNDSEANWSTINPVLLKGEIGINTDTYRIKIGDGVTTWNNLSYQDILLTDTFDTAAADTVGVWTVTVPGVTSLYNGLTIKVRLSTSYNGTFNTLNVNNLGAKLVWYRAGEKLTSHIPRYSVITLVYRTDAGSYTNGITYTGGWVLQTSYVTGDTWNQMYYSENISLGETIYGYDLLMMATNNKWYPVTKKTSDSATSTTVGNSTIDFIINSDILWYISGTDCAAGNISTSNIRITTPSTINNPLYGTFTQYKNVYLVGTITNGNFKIDTTNYWTHSLPTTDDGRVYLYLGYMSTVNTMRLSTNHPIYWFKDGVIQPYAARQIVSNSTTTSGFTNGHYLYNNNGVIGAAALPTNADTVDNKHASDFAAASHLHTIDNVTDIATGTCSTAANTAAKALTVTNFVLKTGAIVLVKFAYSNTVANPTLNINNTGAKPIFYNGVIAPTDLIVANDFIVMMYDGTNWIMSGTLDYATSATSLVNGESGIVGTSSRVARADHTHTLPSFAPGMAGVGVSSVILNSDTNVASGLNSFATGNNTRAYGEGSHSQGNLTVAQGYYSHAEGFITEASGQTSHAEGSNTTASGNISHVEGNNTTTYGDYSHAEGASTAKITASIPDFSSSTTISAILNAWKSASSSNYFSAAAGKSSHIEGTNNLASGISSHAEGEKNLASGQVSHAEGYNTMASGDYSHAEGSNTTASGNYSHAEGNYTTASSTYSHAEGYNTKASSNYSHAEGYNATASGQSSHAEGNYSTASGSFSHAEGSNTTASGYSSHAGGNSSKSQGSVSFTHGDSLNAYNFLEFVLGTYNSNSNTNPSYFSQTGNAFMIGNGTTYNTSSNAFRITFDGKVYAKSAFNSTGADYAEWFEWLDGNTNNEDRRGYFVTLDGEKIKIAKSNDYILGIVSAIPAVIGNAHEENWNNMYIKDEFGIPVLEKIINEETNEEQIVFKINPDYDSEKTYIPRSQRKEWSTVGMLGQLTVRDNGLCNVNSYCSCDDNGTAIPSQTGYRVIKRVSDNLITVIFK